MPTSPGFYQDPYAPVLRSSASLRVSQEQKDLIKEVVRISTSDSRFAEKLYAAIVWILTHGSDVVPTVASLSPNTAVLGTPSFTLHVFGTGFDTGSIIVFNGFDEPTTFISPTEITTGVNMDVWQAAATLPVGVRSSVGLMSNTQMFSFTHPVARISTPPDIKEPKEEQRFAMKKGDK